MADTQIRVVAFDVYRTLACWPDTRVRPIEVQRLLERFGVEISYQAYEAARQGVLFFDAPRRRIEGWIDWLALVFARMGATVSTDLLASIATMYETRDEMQVYPDALPAIDAARAAGLTTCAFTTLPAFFLEHGGGEILRRLDHYFDAAAVGLPKGGPSFYRRITARLGVRPESILCVGDDPLCDAEIPGEVGWRPVLLDREAAHDRDAPSGIPRIATLDELRAHYSAGDCD